MTHTRKLAFITALATLVLALPAQAALNAYAELTVDGTPLDGDVTTATIGGVDVSENHIEFYEYNQGTTVGEKGKEVVLGPLTLLKRIDGTSPQLLMALTQGQTIAGTLKIFDNDPDSGETRLRFTIEFGNGRVTALEQRIPDAFDAEDANRPPLEVLRIKAGSILLQDELSGNASSWTDLE